MQDPVADMLTCIRNAQSANKETVSFPFSKHKMALAEVLVKEGYMQSVEKIEVSEGRFLAKAELKYFNLKPVINVLKRVSKPSRRVYRAWNSIPRVMGGYGVTILSTSQGLLTDKEARKIKVGGEILCEVS